VCCSVLQFVAECCRVLHSVAVSCSVCCSELHRVAACCSAILHMRGGEEREQKKVEETSRECEGVTNPKSDWGKEIEREGWERKERCEAREGGRDQSVPCTRSIRTCSNKLHKSLFICQSLSATPTGPRQLTLMPAMNSRCTSPVLPSSAALNRRVSFFCATGWCSVLQCVAVRCSVVQCVVLGYFQI